MSKQKFCIHCGSALKENAKYCNQCGAPVLPDDWRPSDGIESDANMEEMNLNDTPEQEEEAPAAERNSGKETGKKNRLTILCVIIIIIAAIVAIIIVFFCRGTFLSPERAVQKYYDRYLISEIDPEGLWDDCVDDYSKQMGFTFIDKDHFSDSLNSIKEQDQIKFLDYTADSSESTGININDKEIYRVTGTLLYSDSGEEKTREVNSYVCKSGGMYRLILYGVIEEDDFYAYPRDEMVTCTEMALYYCLDGYVLLLSEITNNSSFSLEFDTAEIEAVFDSAGGCQSTYAQDVSIDPGTSQKFYAFFVSANEHVTEVIVHNMLYLDNSTMDMGYTDMEIPLQSEAE